ncbi:MAG: glycosyltransferase family 2 protein [Pseudomonadota bacterium]
MAQDTSPLDPSRAAPAVSIIVVSYNTRDMTLACLRSVYEETRTPFELIVVDNASSDGSAEAIAAEFPKATLLAETDNHGFAAANNLAATHARAPFVLLLNPDTVILDGAVDRLMAFSQARPGARIWGGRTYFGDRTLNPASAWHRMTLWNLFCRASGLTALGRNSPLWNGEAYGGWDRSTERAVDIVTGCFFLIARADWEALGGFDLTFVMYGEEADLCLRAQKSLGAAPRVTPEANIIHYGGASETVRADKMVRLNRAKMELISRHFPAWQVPLARALYLAWPLSRFVASSLLRRGSSRDWSEIWSRRSEWRHGFGSGGSGR